MSSAQPKSGLTLDLRWRGFIGREHTPDFNRLALEIQAEFVCCISTVSKQFLHDMDWWTENVSSRNTFTSPLFYRICSVLYVEQLLASNIAIEQIIVDSSAQARLIKSLLQKQHASCKVVVQKPRLERLRNYLMPLAVGAKYLLLWLLVRLLWRKQIPPADKGMIIIDTFVSSGFEHQDRYYPGLWEALSDTERARLWFVPTLYGYSITGAARAIRQLALSERQWLFREQSVRLSDLVYALFHQQRVKKIQVGKCQFRKMDIGELIREELTSCRELGAAVIGLLNQRFFMRLKERGISIRLAVDWSENQVVDKGWNAGVRAYFPEAQSIGYQGYAVTPHYLVMYPTEAEFSAAVLPQRIAVIGRGFVESRKRYCPQQEVFVAPAFRFSKIHSFKAEPRGAGFTILVALPKGLEEAADIIRLLPKALLQQKGLRWILKPHPAQNLAALQQLTGKFPNALQLQEIPFDQLLPRMDLVITSASSVAMETIACGVPAIIIAGSQGLIHNPIPEEIPQEIWWLCHSSEDIYDVIKSYLGKQSAADRESLKQIGAMICAAYFEPVTPEGIRAFLGLSYDE